jgi:Domain of unknown function (DUF927)
VTRPASETGTPETPPGSTPAQMLETAVRWSDGNGAKTLAYLKSAGYTLRKGRERDPAFAPHGVNVSDAACNFSYSAEGSPGHEECCAGYERWLYLGDREAARIPWIHGIVAARNGRSENTAVLMSATGKSKKRVPVSWDDIDKGTWATLLETPLSADHKIMTAATTVIKTLAWAAGIEKLPASVTPAMRTATGHIPEPVIECMPDGYWAQPDATEAERLQARADQAEIAAGRPKIALTWGASVGSAFVGPLKLRQSGTWQLTGGPREGKTTTLMLAASAWGYPEYPPDGMLVSWNQTTKGADRYTGELGIFPPFFDETGTSDNGAEEWARWAYGNSMGASRQTAKNHGMGTNRTPGWQGLAFISGNGNITDGATTGKNAGVAARVVTLSGEFTGSAEECKQLDAAVLADYGHVGPAAIKALTVDEFGEIYRAALESLNADPGGIPGTLAAKVAIGVAGARAIDLVLGTGTAIGDAAHRGALDYLSTLEAIETDRERILRRIGELLSAEKMSWPDAAKYSLDQYRSYAGIVDDAWVYVYPSTWAEITASTGVGNSAKLALADMHDRGELHVPERRRRTGSWVTVAPRFAGRATVYQIRLSAVAAASDADADDSGNSLDGTADSAAAPSLTSTDNSGNSKTAPDRPSEPGNSGNSGPTGGGNSAAPHLTSTDNSGNSGNSKTAPPVGKNTAEDWPADSIGGAVNEHQDAAPVPPSPAAAAPKMPRAAWLADTRKRVPVFVAADTSAVLDRMTGLLDANPDKADRDAVRALANSLHVLAALEGTGKDWGGPFVPTRGGKTARLKPWKDGLPVCVEMARVVEGWAWQRTGYSGPVTGFDRNGAWVAAAATVDVAHGALARTGDWDAASPLHPGYYQVAVYPWTETGMPAPLGNAAPGTAAWVPAPTMGLLRELAAEGRWPDDGAADSWTGEPVRLAAWAHLTRELRRYALEHYGHGSGAYEAVKEGFSTALSMLNGTLAEDTAMPRRVWKKCKAERIDWRHQIQTHSAVTMWRAMDRCRKMTDGNPDLAPIGMRDKDELLIPSAAETLITTKPYPGGKWPPVRVDNSRVTLGTFKLNSREEW